LHCVWVAESFYCNDAFCQRMGLSNSQHRSFVGSVRTFLAPWLPRFLKSRVRGPHQNVVVENKMASMPSKITKWLSGPFLPGVSDVIAWDVVQFLVALFLGRHSASSCWDILFSSWLRWSCEFVVPPMVAEELAGCCSTRT